MKIDNYIRLLIFFYGSDVLEAKLFDEQLRHIADNPYLRYQPSVYPERQESELIETLLFLEREDLIKKHKDNSFTITPKGRLKLSKGGFITEAKKEKNALFALYISLLAFGISVVSFVLGIFD